MLNVSPSFILTQSVSTPIWISWLIHCDLHSNSQAVKPCVCSEGSLLICFSGLEGGLHNLEGICSQRVPVFVWVELNRQFAVKLGEVSRLLHHLSHACNKHVLGSLKEFVDHERLVFGNEG